MLPGTGAAAADGVSDLRAVTSALWLNSEIERSGDLMTNIAKATRRIYGTDHRPEACAVCWCRCRRRRPGSSGWRWTPTSRATRDLAAALDDIDDRLDNLNSDTVQAIFETFGQ